MAVSLTDKAARAQFVAQWRAIYEDPQHEALLIDIAEAIIEGVPRYTSVDISPERSKIIKGRKGPSIIVGATDAGAVSVEFGTRYRYASAPIRRAALEIGIQVPR